MKIVSSQTKSKSMAKNLAFCFFRPEETPPGAVPAVLDWKYVYQNMAWSVIIVLGGGFAMADAVKVGNFVLTNELQQRCCNEILVQRLHVCINNVLAITHIIH